MIQDDWEERIKTQWLDMKRRIREEVIHQFGAEDCENKIEDFSAIGPQPWSVAAGHNQNLRAARKAFVAGAYYPALVATTALGERILNQVILELRDFFPQHPATKRVAAKSAFDNWTVMIRVLRAWDVLPQDVADNLERLRRLRNDVVHYNLPTLDAAARDEALEALQLLQASIERLFHPDPTRHLIPGIDGCEFFRLDAETEPFVQRFFLPASVLVSPEHEWAYVGEPTVSDNQHYGMAEGITVLSDEDFAARFNDAKAA